MGTAQYANEIDFGPTQVVTFNKMNSNKIMGELIHNTN